MARYFLTNKAVADLAEIWEYGFETWSENQADKYYRQLIQSCEAIAKRPAIGKKYPDIDHEILGLRVNEHIIFYRVRISKDIEVLRILHGRMDLKNKVQE